VTYWWTEMNIRPVWVEITRRPGDEIGFDLNHEKKSHHAYTMLSLPARGDRVLHWDSKRGEFVGTSIVAGRHVDDGDRRTVPVQSFKGFPAGSLTLEAIRHFGPRIGEIRENLGQAPFNYPFAPYGTEGWKRPRPALAYLTAAPPELVKLLGGIYESGRSDDFATPSWKRLGLGNHSTHRALPLEKTPGFLRYKEANEGISFTSSSEPSAKNTDALESSYQEHNKLQNHLARWLTARGLRPESKRAMDKYPVDIQWKSGKKLFIGEVKSLARVNELNQMRLGIGQLLHYCYLAEQQHPDLEIIPVLITPYDPKSEWLDVCERSGVTLVWPRKFSKLLTF
jgi:hypothetical protein